jgi:hypothetical protein
MTETSPYRYSLIKHNELRLLRFIDDQDHISATLTIVSIDDPLPAFHTLSYTWADGDRIPKKPWYVEIENQRLPVLVSLKSFVDTLRSKDMLLDGRNWWIDSICIDQENLKERAEQVQLMHTIYQQSEQVIVWLGEESDDSSLGVDFVETLDEVYRQKISVEDIRARFQVERYQPHWKALENLTCRKWWSRIWTVQEYVLPTHIILWCGLREVDRSAFCNSLSMADKCPDINLRYTMPFRYGFNRRRLWQLYTTSKTARNRLSCSLLSMTAYFCCMHATDDRDRLYGIMALASDASLFKVDYSISTCEVYLRFAQAFIDHHKSLDVICFASTYCAPADSMQPSWVPDWHKRDAYLVVPSMVSQSCNSHIGNLRAPHQRDCDSPARFCASGERRAEYIFDGPVLLARGSVIDIVEELAASRDSVLSQTSETEQPQDWSDDTPDSSYNIVLSVCKSLVLDRKDRFLAYKMPIQEFLKDFLGLCAPLVIESACPAPPREMGDWFARTRSMKFYGRSLESILREVCLGRLDLSDFAPVQDEYTMDSFFGRFVDVVVRLSFRLMFSKYRRIGTTVDKARKGDLICILLGCSVPVLLRRSKQDENSFVFVGECFLDGSMDGTAFQDSDLQEKTFHKI